MPPDNSTYPDDWARIAEKNLARVGKLLDTDDPDAAGLCLRQAIEKYLKAFLLAKKWKLKGTHDLEALLHEAIRLIRIIKQHLPGKPGCETP